MGKRYYSLDRNITQGRGNTDGDNFLPARKALGQNWLRSNKALRAIIQAAELRPDDTVLEIGPGTGFLTAALLKNAGRVIAVEKDTRLIAYLQEKFAPEITRGKLELIHDDILKFNPETLPRRQAGYNLKPNPYKLISNIPYYLTGKLLRQFLTAKNQPSRMVLLLQKEVAERIMARDGKESILSISVKVFGEPEYIEKVPAGAFSPAPKVDSAILLIKNISRERLKGIDEAIFFALLKKGFGQKRKMLKNALGPQSTPLLKECKISETARPENLRLADWLCLTQNLKADST